MMWQLRRQAAGCAELVAETQADHVRLAVELSGSPERLTNYRKNLRRMVKEFSLSDATKFAGKLEATFSEILQHETAASHSPQ